MRNGMYDTPLLATFPGSRAHRGKVRTKGLSAGAGLSDALVHEQANEVREARRNRGHRDGEHHTEGVGVEHHNRGKHRVSHVS